MTKRPSTEKTKKLRERFRDDPFSAWSFVTALCSLILSGLAFLVPQYEAWEATQPKFNVSCEELTRTKAFYQDRNKPGAHPAPWSSVLDRGPPISGLIGSLAHCEYYNLQSNTVSIREIVNTYYYDRSISTELPNYRDFFDIEKTNRLADVTHAFPITVSPGTGSRFMGLFLFPVGDLTSVKDERCQRLLEQEWTTLGEIDYCVQKLHGKPLVNLLYEGQEIGLGSINAIGLMIVFGDRLEIHYKPSMQNMPFRPNDKYQLLNREQRLSKSTLEEAWARYP
jgi:hypothetical protein